MIEIIEHGTKQTRKCKACGCKFSFENVDIEYSTHCNPCIFTGLEGTDGGRK